MPDDKLNMAKQIGVSVAGSLGGNKVADKLGLGQVGHIVSSVTGSMAANDAEQHYENRDDKK